MKQLIENLKPLARSKAFYALLAVAGLFFAVALYVGVSDNPPGIAVFYGSMCALVVAFVHKWQKPKSFLILMVSSVVGFAVFAVLHNVFYAVGIKGAAIPGVSGLMEFLHVGSFLIALMLCPAGAVVGGGRLHRRTRPEASRSRRVERARQNRPDRGRNCVENRRSFGQSLLSNCGLPHPPQRIPPRIPLLPACTGHAGHPLCQCLVNSADRQNRETRPRLVRQPW